MADTDDDWRRWGEIDPYFAVLTDRKFRKGTVDDHIDEFFQSGRDYIAERLEKARRYFDFAPAGQALDFGCGVGRLALPMAERFEHVVGLDISPAMLAEARRNQIAAGRDNVTFAESDDALSQAEGPFAFVNSYIVLQHIPISRGLPLIDRLLGLVAPEGIAALHVSVHQSGGAWRRAAYWAWRTLPGVRNLANMARGRAVEPPMQMNPYPLTTVLEMMSQRGFGPCIVEAERHGDTVTVKLLARRDHD